MSLGNSCEVSDHFRSSLRVHLFAGLPTEAVKRGFAQAGEMMPVLPLSSLGNAIVEGERQVGVQLPPFVEPSALVESWEGCNFLASRFGRPAHIAGVSTFLDMEHLGEQLTSAASLSSRGWGRGDRDARSVADLVVEQIESSTHLILVGTDSASGALVRDLAVLNPGAARIPCGEGSSRGLGGLALVLGADGGGDRAEQHPPQRTGSSARSARVVPPWLDAMRAAPDAPIDSNAFIYRRARPFDASRLQTWLERPPRGLLRGKGHVWLAGEPEQSFGYSCAGSVHRLFPAGRWWASHGEGVWPNCSEQRRRLLERWHPRFGDRRQEIVFLGSDLDANRLRVGLDACLLEDESTVSQTDVPELEDLGTPSWYH